MFADARRCTCIVYHHLLTGHHHSEAFAQWGICTHRTTCSIFLRSRVLAVDWRLPTSVAALHGSLVEAVAGVQCRQITTLHLYIAIKHTTLCLHQTTSTIKQQLHPKHRYIVDRLCRSQTLRWCNQSTLPNSSNKRQIIPSTCYTWISPFLHLPSWESWLLQTYTIWWRRRTIAVSCADFCQASIQCHAKHSHFSATR